MSRFLSHREVKAATRVMGGMQHRMIELSTRVQLLEKILLAVLKEQNKDFVLTQDGDVELFEKIEAVPDLEVVAEASVDAAVALTEAVESVEKV